MPSKQEIEVACERIERWQRYVRAFDIRLNRSSHTTARWGVTRLLQASRRRLRKNQERLARMLVQ